MYSAFRTVGVAMFLLASLHAGKIVDNGLGQILQLTQLKLKWLQLLRLGNLY